MRTREPGLWALLSFVTGAIVTGAFFVMFAMDEGSRAQGGRYYVAIGALVILGVLDTQIERFAIRLAPRRPWTTPPERRYAGISLLLWLAAAVVLLGGAWLLR